MRSGLDCCRPAALIAWCGLVGYAAVSGGGVSVVRALVMGMKKNLPFIAEHLPDLPQLVFKALDRIANDEVRQESRSQQIDELKQEIQRGNRRSIRAVIGASFVISASIIVSLDGLAPIMVGTGQLLVPLASAALLIPGLYLLISSYLDD